MSDPRRALEAYLIPFKYLISFGWPAAACFLLSPRGRLSRYSLFLLTFVFLYTIPVSIGDSPRSAVMIMGAYVPSLALLTVVLMDLVGKISPKKWAAGLTGVLFIIASAQFFYGWLLYDVDFIRISRAERKMLTAIEQTLVSSGMKSPTEVFADRYDFYTPYKMPYRSRQIGNWSQDWIWGFSSEFPPLPNDSWDSFAAACTEQGVRYLVLSPNSFYRGDIFPLIYHQEVEVESLGLQFIAQRGNIRIYMFK
jgi:hypothetical protein